MSDQLFVATAFLLAGVVLLVSRAYLDRSERGRDLARRTYAQGASPYFFRVLPAVAPFLGVAAIVIGLVALAPRSVALWALGPALGAVGLTFLASYRVPQPGMSKWMREEVQAAQLAPAVPDRLDWVMFWAVLVLTVAGVVSILFLAMDPSHP